MVNQNDAIKIKQPISSQECSLDYYRSNKIPDDCPELMHL